MAISEPCSCRKGGIYDEMKQNRRVVAKYDGSLGPKSYSKAQAHSVAVVSTILRDVCIIGPLLQTDSYSGGEKSFEFDPNAAATRDSRASEAAERAGGSTVARTE